ncbi:hypothetical protein DIURU_003284 [Diutina rugosa]|uniref:Gti1/Pac2 family protein n=1 Tax=Diutina rugosa TaxID=5481 RepID=A0A642ULZ0_DIURU|nr:uncharacterized protein DIURU_003284 [Diutina rugosa]KAA8901339.1 hypothetical protein DIURU_003284 [Diutina rugosa]
MSLKLSPSYYGYVGSTQDALLIIQEILHKRLDLVPRRPHERERPELIQSGNVFVFIEEHSGIKRWTDGIAWSPSRILGRFLVYRELDKQSLSEKDDRKKKRRKVVPGGYDTSTSVSSANGSSVPSSVSSSASSVPVPGLHQPQLPQSQQPPPQSLAPYVFKDKGLIKKTLSLTTSSEDLHIDGKPEKQTIHLISYYNAEDVLNGKLVRPSESEYKHHQINVGLWNAVKDSSLGGKIPIEDEAYYFLDNNYQLQNMSALSQKQPAPAAPGGYPQGPPGMPTPSQQWGPPPPHPFPRVYMDYPQAPLRHNSVPQSSSGYDDSVPAPGAPPGAPQYGDMAPPASGALQFNNPFPVYYSNQGVTNTNLGNPGINRASDGAVVPPSSQVPGGVSGGGSALGPVPPAPVGSAPAPPTSSVTNGPYQPEFNYNFGFDNGTASASAPSVVPAPPTQISGAPGGAAGSASGADYPQYFSSSVASTSNSSASGASVSSVTTPSAHKKAWAPPPPPGQPQNGWYTAAPSADDASPVAPPAPVPSAPVYSPTHPPSAPGAPQASQPASYPTAYATATAAPINDSYYKSNNAFI